MSLLSMKHVVMDSPIVIGSREYRINVNRSKKQGCFIEILRAIETNLTDMLSSHCKVIVVQFVFHCHDYEEKNEGMSDLIRVMKKRLSSKYCCPKVRAGWVRETGKSGIHHYHVALFLNGNKVRWNTGVQDLINVILEDRDYPRPSFVPSHMVKRNDEKSIFDAFYHLSYLAKVKTKVRRSKTAKDYSFSRIRKK